MTDISKDFEVDDIFILWQISAGYFKRFVHVRHKRPPYMTDVNSYTQRGFQQRPDVWRFHVWRKSFIGGSSP